MKPRGFSARDTQDFLRFMEKLAREQQDTKTDQLLLEDLELSQIPDDLMYAASLDDQIDQFFMKGEKDANTEGEEEEDTEPKMGEAITSYAQARYLFEQEPTGDDDPLAGAEGDASGGDEEPVEPEEEQLPPFDPNVFARQVARLVDNYDNLLDIPSVIVNRAIKYLLKHYDEETVEQVKEILAQSFDIDMSPEGERNVDPEPHYAMGALGGGTAQSGGLTGDVGGGTGAGV